LCKLLGAGRFQRTDRVAQLVEQRTLKSNHFVRERGFVLPHWLPRTPFDRIGRH
jgi:hypothetical protein